MKDAPGETPPYAKLDAALRKITETLAREIAAPTNSDPAWSDFEWRTARAVVAMHGMAGLLASRLRWRGPAGWAEFLEEQREQVASIGEQVCTLVARLDAGARSVGVPFLALKGAAILELGLYGRGERPMGDLDVLIEPADEARFAHVILPCGYEAGHVVSRHHTYFPLPRRESRGFGEHRDNPLRIELHKLVSEPLPVDEVDITTALWPTTRKAGVNGYRDLAALMRHMLIHAAGNIRARCLRYVQLQDIALIARRMNVADWNTLLDPAAAADPWWAYPPLALTAEYLPGSIPAEPLARARAHCPPLLRLATHRQRLHSVSWSNLRIQAFPGIEWSRSALEALRFMRSRAMPSRAALGEIADTLRGQPSLGTLPWYQLPHAARIARWVFSRPPRVQTMLSVRAALDATASPGR